MLNHTATVRWALVPAIVLLSVAPSTDATTGWRIVAANHAYAIYAKLDVSAKVNGPAAIALRVISSPSQKTNVKWSWRRQGHIATAS